MVGNPRGKQRSDAFLQDHLKANVEGDAALKYLKTTYAKYLDGIVEDDDADAANEPSDPDHERSD